MTQQGLAMRAHLSKAECGQKPASPALVAACARALGVSHPTSWDSHTPTNYGSTAWAP
ncbi:hypothetical protein ACGF3J_02790 [Streptomyces sp. NPDC048171]|uniref:hypothetical protein n=1 Tax=unclassified Streptomyces TaxID=2593676 RepID=UPI001F2EDD5F|nr:hypothetical protein [Streptomyces sp. SID5789]